MSQLSDIHYEEEQENQDAGNPDMMGMLKNLLGSNSNSTSTNAPPYQPVATSDQQQGNAQGIELSSDGASNVLGSRKYAHLTPEQKAEAKAHAEKMQKLIDDKLAQMTPEQREAFQQRQAMMQKAIMAQMKIQQEKQQQGGGDDAVDDLEREDVAKVPRFAVQHETELEQQDKKLMFAVRSGNVEDLDKFLSEFKRDVNTSIRAPADEQSHPLLHWAALNDQKEVIEYMLDKNVNLDQRNPRGEVALHWASLNGNLRAVHILIDNGCDRMACDGRGYSAMHHAAQFGRNVVLACLHRRGLHVDIRDNNGRTPLHWACYKGENYSVQWLVEHGADIKAEDFEQCLPIHWAALQGFYGTCSILIKYGSLSLLHKKDRTGGNAKDLAREKQARYAKDSYQYNAYKRVGDYLESCEKQKKDTAKENKKKKHPTWYTWPVMAPIGFWQYYTVVFPETYYFPIATFTFWVFYFAEWVSWTMLQMADPGTYVIRDNVGKSNNNNPHQHDEDNSSSSSHDTRIKIGDGDDEDDEYCVNKVNTSQPGARTAREMYQEVLDNGLLVPVCTTCEIVKPVRSKHDRFTDVCVARFDHFCPFMGVAVGERNYRLFFFSMLNAMLAMYAWLYMVIQYTWQYDRSAGFFANFWETIYWQLFAWSYAPIAIYATVMVAQHSMFIKRNITTNEVLNRHRYKYLANKQNPFDRGFVTNVLEFFGAEDPVNIDLRKYYEYFFEGRSEQVEKNNRQLRYGMKEATPMPEEHGHSHQQQQHHGHSHGGRPCHGHGH